MKKAYSSLFVLALSLLGVISKAQAHDSFGLSINLGSPAFHAPPPAIYYAPPPVVHYRPAPIYYGPSVAFRFHDHDHGWHDHRPFRHGWGKHGKHGKHGHGHGHDD